MYTLAYSRQMDMAYLKEHASQHIISCPQSAYGVICHDCCIALL